MPSPGDFGIQKYYYVNKDQEKLQYLRFNSDAPDSPKDSKILDANSKIKNKERKSNAQQKLSLMDRPFQVQNRPRMPKITTEDPGTLRMTTTSLDKRAFDK